MSAAKTLLVAAIASLAFAGVASARELVVTAKFEAPVSGARYIAQNSIWSCEGDTCRARVNHAVSVRACRQLVRQITGRVTAYGAEGDELSADEIARCNGEQAQAQAAN